MTSIHRAIILLNCLMITSAFRASILRHNHGAALRRNLLRFDNNGILSRIDIHRPHRDRLFSTTSDIAATTADSKHAADDDGSTYRIKPSSYVDTKYDTINKSDGLTGSYDPASFERKVYDWWENAGCFDPDRNKGSSRTTKEPYVLPMPPPNVTGRLHMGHAIFVALQDVLARFHRMRGKEVLWTPGTDHAGIATQLQVRVCFCFVDAFVFVS